MENIANYALVLIGGILIGSIISGVKNYFKNRLQSKEMEEYKQHLNRTMKITSEGTKKLEDELSQMKEENSNLKISLQTLNQKPGNAEIRLLNIYDNAIRKVSIKSPGFAPVWELSLMEAEAEYANNEKGFKFIINKAFGKKQAPSYSQETNQSLLALQSN
jgi:hypothetical protein